MGCPNCAKRIHGADAIDVQALVREARQAGDGPLRFCDRCKADDGVTQSADGLPLGVGPLELSRILAADAAPDGGPAAPTPGQVVANAAALFQATGNPSSLLPQSAVPGPSTVPLTSTGETTDPGGISWSLVQATSSSAAPSTVWTVQQGSNALSGTLSPGVLTNSAAATDEINSQTTAKGLPAIPDGQLVLPTPTTPTSTGALSSTQLATHATQTHSRRLKWILGLGLAAVLVIVLWKATHKPSPRKKA
jgi:hypothetical protein